MGAGLREQDDVRGWQDKSFENAQTVPKTDLNSKREKATTMADVTETTLDGLGARIDTLEMRIAYQDDVIEDLNKVIVEQWSKFDQMLGRLERLESRIRDSQDNAGQDGYDEPPPPHY